MFIKVSDNSLETSKRLLLPEAFQLLFSAALHMMNSVVDTAAADSNLTSEQRTIIKGDIYDMFNIGASNVLSIFDPETSPRDNLTAEAIMQAENAILDANAACENATDAKETPETPETPDEADYAEEESGQLCLGK